MDFLLWEKLDFNWCLFVFQVKMSATKVFLQFLFFIAFYVLTVAAAKRNQVLYCGGNVSHRITPSSQFSIRQPWHIAN